jgi:hypothetical protein
MSAFIVEHAHIDALVSWAAHNRVSVYLQTTGNRVDVAGNETQIGKWLMEENEKSVLSRYPQDTLDSAPGCIGERSTNYKFREFLPALKPVEVLKACHCLDYQSCEHDEWPQSLAYGILQSIERAAMRQLPGYENAPWGVPKRVNDRHLRRVI